MEKRRKNKIKCHTCGKVDYKIIEDDIYHCNACGSEFDLYALTAKKGKKKYMLEMMEKLLPCRKCGQTPWAEEYGHGQFHIVEIFCSNKKCDNVEAWHRKEIKNAITAWNEREEGKLKSKIKVINLKD